MESRLPFLTRWSVRRFDLSVFALALAVRVAALILFQAKGLGDAYGRDLYISTRHGTFPATRGCLRCFASTRRKRLHLTFSSQIRTPTVLRPTASLWTRLKGTAR
jgi:hypothetical protein